MSRISQSKPAKTFLQNASSPSLHPPLLQDAKKAQIIVARALVKTFLLENQIPSDVPVALDSWLLWLPVCEMILHWTTPSTAC